MSRRKRSHATVTFWSARNGDYGITRPTRFDKHTLYHQGSEVGRFNRLSEAFAAGDNHAGFVLEWQA